MSTINQTLLQKLVELNSLEEIIVSLPDHLYTAIGDVEDIYNVEHKLNTELMQAAQYTLRWRSFTKSNGICIATRIRNATGVSNYQRQTFRLEIRHDSGYSECLFHDFNDLR